MVGTYHLIVVNRLHKRNISLFHGIDHRRSKLEVDIIHVNHVRLEIVQNLAQLALGLRRLDDLEGIKESGKPLGMKVHIGRI